MSNSINLEQWVREHKKEFAENLIARSGAQPYDTQIAFFMAGLPGAGKTEFSKALINISEIKFLRLDMDEIASQIDTYRPEIADQYRRAASALLDKTFDLTLHKKLSFIMDGTLSHQKSLQNIERVLKHNYKTKILYLIQDPKIAWDFTQAREKVEHRLIDQNGFIEFYCNLQQILKEILSIKNDSLSVDCIVKNSNNHIVQWESNINAKYLDQLVKPTYNKKTLKDYLNGHTES